MTNKDLKALGFKKDGNTWELKLPCHTLSLFKRKRCYRSMRVIDEDGGNVRILYPYQINAWAVGFLIAALNQEYPE